MTYPEERLVVLSGADVSFLHVDAATSPTPEAVHAAREKLNVAFNSAPEPVTFHHCSGCNRVTRLRRDHKLRGGLACSGTWTHYLAIPALARDGAGAIEKARA